MKNKLTLLMLLSIVILTACRKNTETQYEHDDESGWGIKRLRLTLDSLKMINSNIPKAEYRDLAFADSLTGYAITTGAIIKTTDGGATWTSTISPNGVPLNRIQFTDKQTGYIAGGAGNAGILLKTTNAGQTWDIINFGTTEPLIGMYFTSNTVGFVIGKDLFSKTTDGGQTWTSIKEQGVTGFHDIRFNGLIGVVTAANGIYFKTINGGFTWQKAQVLTLNDLGNVYLSPTQVLIDKAGGEFIDLNDKDFSLKIPPYNLSKMVFMDEHNAIGIGASINLQGDWRDGKVVATDRGWYGGYSLKTLEDLDDRFAFSAVAPMSKRKVMLIGTGVNVSKVAVLNMSYE